MKDVVIFLVGAATASLLIALVYMFKKNYRIRPAPIKTDCEVTTTSFERMAALSPAPSDIVGDHTIVITDPIENGWDGTERRHRDRASQEVPEDHHRRRLEKTVVESSWPPRQEPRRW